MKIFSKSNERPPLQTNSIAVLREWLSAADCVLIGAGAGLSTSAGFTYTGKRFREYFHDFEAKYGFHDMYSGGFYPYDTPEEHWAYWSRYIFINRYSDAPVPVYETLLALVKDKNHFVLTTNVDHCFQKAGFDKSRLFYTQGDYGLFQCSVPCHNHTYDNEQTVREMVRQQKDMKIPSELVPRCPACGKPMTMNLRADKTFVEDEGWHNAANRYETFLKENAKGNILFLELGVGFNTPGIIKYPFMRMTALNKRARYVCINKGEVYIPKEIESRSLGISDDINETLTALEELK